MKSRKKRMKKKQQQTLDKFRKFFLYFAMILIFIVPLVVFYKQVDVPKSAEFLYGEGRQLADFFTYYKAIIFQIGTLFLFIGALFYRLLDDFNFKPDLFEKILGGLTLAVLASLTFSNYKTVALTGYLDRYEGTLTWLSYIGLSYSIYTFVKDKADIHKILGSLVASSGVISTIGFFQSKGIDFFRSDFGRKLILGSNYEKLKDVLVFKFAPDRVYSTLFNPNYVGSLVAIAFPLTMYLILEVKNKAIKVVLAIIALMQVLTLAGSKSATGFAAISVGIAAFVLMQLIKTRFEKKRIIIVIAILLVIAIGVTQTSIFKNEFSKIKASLDNMDEPVYNTFEAVEYNHPRLIVTLENGKDIYFEPEGRDLLVFNSNDEAIERVDGQDSYSFDFSEDGFNIKVIKDVKGAEVTVRATNTENNITRSLRFHQVFMDQFSLRYQKLTSDNIQVDTVNWIKNEKSFSGRGYIWNRSIPMIFDKPILGYGADTFTLNFPQIDLVGNAVAIGSQIVDKPHNFYINILINFGLLGILILAGLTILILVKSYKNEISVAILAFLVAGIANDSVLFCTYMIFVIFAILAKLNFNSEQEIN